MVEINNQRKAFLDMLAWSEELITDVRKPEIMVMTSLWAESGSFWLLRSPSQTCQCQTPKLKSTGAGRHQLLSRWWDAYRKQLGLKDSSPKSQDAVALQQIKECGRLPMIDRGDIRQAIDRCSNIWLHCRALVMVVWSIRLTAWLQNSKKRAEWSERLMYEQSHRDYSPWVICIIVCLSWAVNHYRDNAITYKAQRDKKCQRTEAGERGNYWHDASAWCCCARCKIHEGVSWC